MKRTFSILILLCLTFVLSAQDYELYKCTRSGYRAKNDNGSWSQWTYADVDMILRLDKDIGKIEFNNKVKSVFYFSELLDEDKGVDNDGDKWSFRKWSGYDEDGLKCYLKSIDYPTLKNRNFVLEYLDYEFVFECIILNPLKNNVSL